MWFGKVRYGVDVMVWFGKVRCGEVGYGLVWFLVKLRGKLQMRKFLVKVKGVRSLLMHNPKSANPLSEESKELKKYTSKGRKTEEDHQILTKIQYMSAAYYSDNLGLYLPAYHFEASFVKGAKENKKGELAKIALTIEEAKIKLKTDAEGLDLETIYENEDFVDLRMVVVNGKNRIVRARPRFERWSCEFNLTLQDDVMSVDQMLTAVSIAGKMKGVGDYRPRYGLYETHIEEVS